VGDSFLVFFLVFWLLFQIQLEAQTLASRIETRDVGVRTSTQASRRGASAKLQDKTAERLADAFFDEFDKDHDEGINLEEWKAAHEAILTPRDEPGHGGLGSNEMVDLLQETDKVLQEQCSELECRIDALEVALEEANKVKVDGSTQLGSRASTPGLAGFQRLAYRQELDLKISDRKDKIGSLQRKVQREKAEVSLLAPNKQGAALKNVQGLEHDLQGMEAVLKRIENAPVDGQYFQLQLEEQLAILNPMEGRVELLMEKIGALESLAEEPEDEEPGFSIETKWLEEINVIHTNIQNLAKEKTGVADVANLESKMMANLKNMKENLNKEINSKAERHDLEEVLKEVVSTVESAALEPNEEAKVEYEFSCYR